MIKDGDTYENFMLEYNSDNFDTAAMYLRVIISNGYKNFKQSQEDIQAELVKLLKEMKRINLLINSEPELFHIISLIGQSLEAGMILSVDQLLN